MTAGTPGSLQDLLDSGKNIRELELNTVEHAAIEDLFLVTEKPVLYVANVDESSMHTGNRYSKALQEGVAAEKAEVVLINNSIEAQIAEMEDPADKALFMSEYGMKEPVLNRLIRSTYKLLQLSTYFTAGVQEVRAWTMHKGDTAPQAAGVIHTDFEKGFIRAEVIGFEDYIACKGEHGAKEAGKMRLEGKDYIVKDGDVMHFRFNV